MNVDLFHDLDLGGVEDAVEIDMIDISGTLSLPVEERREERENVSTSDTESSHSETNSVDDERMDVSVGSGSVQSTNNKPKSPIFETYLM